MYSGEVRLHRYGNLRYENQEHSVEVPLPDGKIDAAAVGEIETGSTPSTSASTRTGSTPPSSSSARTWSCTPRSASSRRRLCRRPGAWSRTRVKGRRSVDFATEGVHESDIYDGRAARARHAIQRPGDRRDQAAAPSSSIPGNEVTVDGYGNLVIAIDAGGEE